jgi:hypothetical protein
MRSEMTYDDLLTLLHWFLRPRFHFLSRLVPTQWHTIPKMRPCWWKEPPTSTNHTSSPLKQSFVAHRITKSTRNQVINWLPRSAFPFLFSLTVSPLLPSKTSVQQRLSIITLTSPGQNDWLWWGQLYSVQISIELVLCRGEQARQDGPMRRGDSGTWCRVSARSLCLPFH